MMILMLLLSVTSMASLLCITAFEQLLSRALLGDAEAQYKVGLCYGNADGVAQDNSAAVNWYRLSANQGNHTALNMLGVCYFKGQGVRADYKEAIRLFRLAAERGNHHAMDNLAICYYNGCGLTADRSEAYFWALLAFILGDILKDPVESQVKIRLDYELDDRTRSKIKDRVDVWIDNYSSKKMEEAYNKLIYGPN